ncbi:zinc ribbon domain-containing protein [Acetilactobacillus jinshanensis]|nr:zinc ribbon domain-containing protein [Acetilactobacillus jinshanensis]URL61001.1 zinc ribbon domain-containing protein [uncultured bacterium]
MTYKYCQNCGKEIPSNAKFCPYCDKAQMIKSAKKISAKDQPRIQVNGDQIMITRHRRISPFNMKVITLITVMMDVIVMVLFSSSWETIASNVRNIGSLPVVIYIIFTLWTSWIEYYFGEKMSKRYNDLMLWFIGIMALVAFAFLVAGTMI